MGTLVRAPRHASAPGETKVQGENHAAAIAASDPGFKGWVPGIVGPAS